MQYKKYYFVLIKKFILQNISVVKVYYGYKITSYLHNTIKLYDFKIILFITFLQFYIIIYIFRLFLHLTIKVSN